MNYFESLVNSMYPVRHSHMFGVNGKISGSIAALGEMDRVIPIIHGPKGCAFYYRYSSRRTHEPFYKIYTSDLKEEDIVFGGTDKLRDLVEKVYKKHEPDLIMIISSTVSDVLNEDIDSVVFELRDRIPVIGVNSELFSHRDKNFGKKRMKELAKQSVKEEKNIGIELKGCGHSELLVSLVNDFMKEEEVEENTLNIETIGWGRDGSRTLEEIESFLEKSGVRIISRFPSGSYDSIESAPRASLNIAKRVRWAREMERKFGTPYLHANSRNRYSGIDGICNFYEDIYRGLDNENNRLMENISLEREKTLALVEEDLEELKEYRACLYGMGLGMLPAEIKTYARDYGLQLPYVVLEMTDINLRNMNLDQETIDRLINRIHESIEIYSPGTELIINPSSEEIDRIREDVDAMVGMTNPSLEKWGIPIIAANTDEAVFTFESYIRSVKRLRRRLENARSKPNILLNLLDFNRSYYPLVDNQDNIASREMWSAMWLRKEEE